MPGAGFLEYLTDPYLMTGVFTWLVIGVVCYAMFVLPQRQKEEAARTVKPTPVEALRKAA